MTTDERLSTLEQVTPLLGMAYKEWKAQEKLKNTYKDAFFALADEAIMRDGLGLRYVEIVAPDEATARARAERHNPGWKLDELRPDPAQQENLWQVILGEDPKLRAYHFDYEGMRYARSVSRGETLLDDEWLAEADPELYGEVTFKLPWGAVIMLPLEQLPQDVLGRVGKYLYTAVPKAKLSPPRALSEEE